ncbi:hypothetical protein [Pleurocapsa sp. FMAR1]|uniref:hypothetical protein n=1 Tax=Pleurocapsa sp. FMAR1 TaxID=3040204 RepID=UPI0029C61CDE|nr:hypothetical protein [Pleurocapsa sp. FMAR1]
MPIYIQSRGKKQDQDYRWLRIKSAEYYPENPDFLMQSIGNSPLKPVNLIESQKQSIILVADRDNYYLLVTGLKTREDRTDFTGRSIRNSVLWICQKDSENIKVRSLLIRVLKGKLDQEIDKTVSACGEYGFKVDYKSLVELFNSVLDVENNRNTDPSCKIGSNSESLRQEIALELQTNPLADRNGLLILVTSIKSASVLKETAVWRGLSNRIDDHEFEEYSSLKTVNQQAQKKTIFLGIAIATLLLIVIVLSIIKFTTLQKPRPEIIPTPSTIQENSSSTSKEELNPSIALIKAKEINYPTSSYISNEEYGI